MRRYERAAGTLRVWSAISTRNMVALAKFFGVSLRELMDKLS